MAEKKPKPIPSTVYTKGEHFTIKAEENTELSNLLNSKFYKALKPASQDLVRKDLEEQSASPQEEVDGWKTPEFQQKISGWLKTYAPPVTDMRATLRFVTLKLAEELSTFDEHEANRKGAGYTLDAYLQLVSPGEGKPSLLSKVVRERYAEEKKKNKESSNLPTGKSS